MKKLIILALMALLATGAFAEVTIGGRLEYETSSSLKADGDETNSKESYGQYDGDIQVLFNIKADDYNTGVLRLRKRSGQSHPYAFDRAHVTTDVGKFFGLPIGWKSQFGLNDWGFAPVGNAKWDTLHRIIPRQGAVATVADPYATFDATRGGFNDYFYDTQLWGIKESFVFQDVFTLNAFFSLNGNEDGFDRDRNITSQEAGYSKLKDFYIDAVFSQAAGPGKLGVELAYMLWTGNSGGYAREWEDQDKEFGFGDGVVLIAAGYSGVPVQGDITLDLGAAFYQPASKAYFSAYGVNAQVNVGKFAYGVVGVQGYLDAKEESGWGYVRNSLATDDYYDLRSLKKEILHNVRIGGGVSPVEFLSIDAGVLLYTGKDTILDNKGEDTKRSVLNTLDISAALKVGKMEYRLGYLYVPDNDMSIDPFAGGDNQLDTNRKALYFKGALLF